MGNLKFGDNSTKNLGLVIQFKPNYSFPERDITIEHIPGRDGDLIIDNGCYQNVTKTYSVAAIFNPAEGFVQSATKIIEWLTKNKGYQRLEDTYEPEVYRMAMFNDRGTLQNIYDRATVFEINFNCKPQRFLKEGDVPIEFVGSEALLENPTDKTALPEIIIKNIIHSDNKVLLLTVEDNDDNVTSTITLSDLPSGDLTISSDLQKALLLIQNGEIIDANKYISLNGTKFPELGIGETKLAILKYTEQDFLIESYESLITNSQEDCLALFKPFDALIETKQKTAYSKSYDLIKQQAQEVYEAESYASYCMRKSKEYTFISYNTILSNSCQSYTFQEDYSSKPDWLTMTESGDNITVTVGNLASFAPYSTSVAYFISSADKKIRKLVPGNEIGTFKKSSTVTITVYPANANDGKLALTYDDIPSWLSFEVEYDPSDNSPSKIVYKANQTGYFYIPKSGMFGKAKWQKFDMTTQASKELASLTWSSYKKAFMPSGISTSTTASFTFNFLPYPYQGTPGSSDYQEYLQYEPTYKDVLDKDGNPKRDANGNVIQEIDNAVHFKVVPTDTSNLTAIKFIAKDAGYFRCNSGDQGTAWRYIDANQDINGNVPSIDNKVDVTNIIYFLSNAPDYSIDDSFPEWLNPVPVKYDSNHEIISQSNKNGLINPSYIDFYVNNTGWYRYTYNENDTDRNTSWIFRNANELLGKIIPDGTHPMYPQDGPEYDGWHSHDGNFFIYYLEGTSSNFPVKEYHYTDSNGVTINDIGFFYTDSNNQQIEYPNNTPPAWLKVLAIVDDGVVTGIKYEVGDSVANTSLLKWDANSVWKSKESLYNDITHTYDIVESGKEDDTSIYYLSSSPDYPAYELYTVQPVFNLTTGNPESVKVKANVAGYYRPKNSSNWKHYKVGDVIVESKISESILIDNLEKDTDESLDELSISVTPRWWML